MHNKLKAHFINLCLKNNIIQFGDFTLKSGRKSPYFYNFGLLYSGSAISEIGKLYAKLIIKNNIDFDVIFGPAYKGIPLAIATIIALKEEFNVDKSYCFNRKLEKDHGEKGYLIGAPINNKVLILDDVITSGISIEQSINLIKNNGGQVTAAITSLDRKEKHNKKSNLSSIDLIENKHKIKIYSLATVDDIINIVKQNDKYKIYLNEIKKYRDTYCTAKNLEGNNLCFTI